MTYIRESSPRGPGSAKIAGIYELDTGSVQYLASDPETRKAALIDVVLNFDPPSASTSTEALEQVLSYVASEQLEVEWILDTHPHADHVMASSELKRLLGAPNGIGARVGENAELWRGFYHIADAFDVRDDFDYLFEDGATFRIGQLPVLVMLSPGHTLGSVTYIVGRDAAFVHDTFMQPDAGTARADFPGGSAAQLYDSLQHTLDLGREFGEDMRLFVGHDYGTDARKAPAWEATVAEPRRDNVHIGGGIAKADYIFRREKRDATLALPDRMLAALQLDLRAGKAPQSEADGFSHLKIPLNRFGKGH